METPAKPAEACISAEPPVRKKRPRLRRVYLGMLLFFVCGVLMQGFFAGAGIFDSGSWFAFHTSLGYILSEGSIVFLIVALIAQLPRTVKWLSVLLAVLAYGQPVLTYFRSSTPLISALHPLNALVLCALPVYLIVRTRQASIQEQQ